MRPDPHDLDVRSRNAIADAARTLSLSDPRAHVFFEERVDLRMTLASSGLRDVVATRTRGAAIAGRHSFHVTDPDFGDLGVAARGLSREGPGSHERDLRDWLNRLEAGIVDAGVGASAGRRHPFWSAKVVSFRQAVWVAPPEVKVMSDVRRGCRVELRVQIGREATAHAMEEFTLSPEGPQALAVRFSRAFDRAEVRISASTAVPLGQTTAVFAAGVAGVVAHELIGHALEGDVLARRTTWIRSTNLPAAGRPVLVLDDPRRGRGAWMIDDEGVNSRETVLVDGERAVGILMDKHSAWAFGAESTGHGRRSSYLEPVRPRMGCTFIAAGSDDPEEVVRSTRSGVFIRRLAAGHTNPFAGRSSFIVTDADRIIDGRLAEPLAGFVMELDAIESWRSIDRVGHDLAFDTCIGSCVRDGQPMAVSVGAPTIRIGVVRVRS